MAPQPGRGSEDKVDLKGTNAVVCVAGAGALPSMGTPGRDARKGLAADIGLCSSLEGLGMQEGGAQVSQQQ